MVRAAHGTGVNTIKQSHRRQGNRIWKNEG